MIEHILVEAASIGYVYVNIECCSVIYQWTVIRMCNQLSMEQKQYIFKQSCSFANNPP